MKPRLDEANVRLVAVGLEELGVEEFVQGGFFKGELFIDSGKDCYKKLGFRRMNVLTAIGSLFGKKTRETSSKAKEENVGGNFAGDGFQNGGSLVIEKGGKAVLTFRQEGPGDHVDPNDVLKALGLEGGVEVAAAPGDGCDSGACALPKKK